MRLGRKIRGLPISTNVQMRNWTVLSLKWPDLTRWIIRGSGNYLHDIDFDSLGTIVESINGSKKTRIS